ncbi:MAG: GNAT family N-acetyltransferase [Myxococcota bacterium]
MSVKPVIRRATLADADRIIEGNQALARETEGFELDPAVLGPGVRAVLEEKVPAVYWVVTVDGTVAAQLMLTYEWSDWRNAEVWWIQSVYVWPEGRRKGLFRALFGHVEETAQGSGAAGLRLYMEVENTAAHGTYTRLGMDGERYILFEKLFTEH